jgi:uncharacterized membrane protein HdeD (DUF308 family)
MGSNVESPDRDSSSVTSTAPKPESRPYRWGYFQGGVLIPLSLLMLLGAAKQLRAHEEPWQLLLPVILASLIGMPLGIGLLMKKKFALVLVYVMFGLAIVQTAIKIPIAVRHFADKGDSSSAFSEAEMLLIWLISLVYYRKRETQFR